MSWLELDDGILRHPKFIRAIRLAGSEAIHLWLGLRAYCGQLLTDGEIPADMVDAVDGPSSKRARNSALEALISVGLIEKTDVGLRMHDYLDWSRSREEIESRRQANAKRQRNHRITPSTVTRDNAVTNALVTPSVTLPSPLPSDPLPSTPHQEEKKEIVTSPSARDGVGVYSACFLQFWNGYPRKVGKGDAWKAWKRIRPPIGPVLLALGIQRGTSDWRKDNGAFIPHPATWLNGRRWEDEPNARMAPARSQGPPVAIAEAMGQRAQELAAQGELERLAAAEEFKRERQRDTGGTT